MSSKNNDVHFRADQLMRTIIAISYNHKQYIQIYCRSVLRLRDNEGSLSDIYAESNHSLSHLASSLINHTPGHATNALYKRKRAHRECAFNSLRSVIVGCRPLENVALKWLSTLIISLLHCCEFALVTSDITKCFFSECERKCKAIAVRNHETKDRGD